MNTISSMLPADDGAKGESKPNNRPAPIRRPNASSRLVPASVYTRVSTDEQAKEVHHSLRAQEAYSMAAIKRHEAEEWVYVATFSDPGYSGTH